MFCPSCAYSNPDNVAVCGACGNALPIGPAAYTPPPPGPYGYGYPPPMYAPPVTRRTSGMAIAGFVLALTTCGVLGLIFSILGHNECKNSNGMVEGGGLALAGIIISIVSLAFWLIYILVVASMFGRM